MRAALLVVACTCLLTPCLVRAQETAGGERVVAIRVHGNHTTPDAEVLRLAGVKVGDAFSEEVLRAVEKRLQDTGRFRSVELRKRYGSIENPLAVVLVIVVEERAGVSVDVPAPGPLRRFAASTMWIPVLSYEDGYGFTYGARFSFVDLLGKRTRLSTPLTWGGERRAAVELERTFERGPFTRVVAGTALHRRENPAYDDTGDYRSELSARAERSLAPWLRIGMSGSWAAVGFGDVDDRLGILGVDARVDTRRDRVLPRNAVFAEATWERLDVDGDTSAVQPDGRRAVDVDGTRDRLRLEAGGGLGLFGQSVLVVRAVHSRVGEPLPAYEQALLGGASTLRGFRTGYRAGDQLAAASAEIRVPLTPLRAVGRSGIALFADYGAVYGAGERLRDARFETGVGAGFFVTATLFSARVDVANGLDAGTRAHVSLGLSF